uniref:BAH domain-containing protein n=1 Tax=Caenorhabditis tropicalis TaxID=1561998 RepID=A0A1I7TMT0_9PELO
MSSGSRSRLQELLVTRYVAKREEIEGDCLETPRAGCSVFQPQNSVYNEDAIEQQGEDVELVEDENYRTVHRIDETPKLVTKRQNITRIRDEAVKVLRNIQNTPSESIRAERYDYFSLRWFHTTRESEKELAYYVLQHPNHRPYFFTMQCRHIEIEDLPELILKSLLSEPRETGQCLARFAIQTTNVMPFSVLYHLLEGMVAENEGFQLSDQVVTASVIESSGKRTTSYRFKTDECKKYGELEPELDEQGDLIASAASITCSIEGKRHVQTVITYRNNSRAKNPTARNRYIEVEQTVKCMNKRVLIVENKAEVVEFEVDKEMIPLKHGIPPIGNLISFLETEDIED